MKRAEPRPKATFFWRRLDSPSHDSCQLFELSGGWRLRGGAAFLEGARACHLAYEVACDPSWRTRSARIVGHAGLRPVDVRISRSPRGWRMNGILARATKDCVDVDLGFTPATNILPIRRLALRVGELAEAPAAYFAFPQMRLARLPQTYRRVDKLRYAYGSPTVGYAGTLNVSRIGAVVRYPGIFESVPQSAAQG